MEAKRTTGANGGGGDRRTKKLASIVRSCPLPLRVAVPTARISIGHRQCGASGRIRRTESANSSLAAVAREETEKQEGITTLPRSSQRHLEKKKRKKNSPGRKGGRAAGSRRGERRHRPVRRFREERAARGGRGEGANGRTRKDSLCQPDQPTSSWRFPNKIENPSLRPPRVFTPADKKLTVRRTPAGRAATRREPRKEEEAAEIIF